MNFCYVTVRQDQVNEILISHFLWQKKYKIDFKKAIIGSTKFTLLFQKNAFCELIRD